MKKVVLAYSGGLDTSVIIPWLAENYAGCEVIAMAADLGQAEELDGLDARAKAAGASKLIIADLTEEFLADFVFPMVRAGAVYEGSYLLGTSIARPLIAKKLVEVALGEGADAVAHGCTGKGNDQVRFELTVKALAPHLTVIAPWREWDLRSREDEIDYAAAHGVDVPVTKKDPYSRDRNIWHLSHEGGVLEDPWNEPLDDMFQLTVSPEVAPDAPEYVEVGFERGNPTSVDGVTMPPVELVTALNERAAAHGVGRTDLVENRLVGMKSRGVYECPGGTVITTAHADLERITLDRDTAHYKALVAERYAELVYFGQWFSPLREALQSFVDVTQEAVTGTVRLKMYKGSATAVGRRSPNSLYSEELATFGEDAVYDQADAGGFINLFGLPLAVGALLRGKGGK